MDEPIEIMPIGLPETIVCSAVVSEKKGDSAKEVKLKVTASAAFQGAIRIGGTVAGKPEFARTAVAATDPLVSDLWLVSRP
jgi:hypothetical protein